MSEQITLDVPTHSQPPTASVKRKTAAKDPHRRALAAYAAGDLEACAAALDAAFEPQAAADYPHTPKPGEDYSILSDYLTWLHAEVPAWIDKARGMAETEQLVEAERCADIIASAADGMFAATKPVRQSKNPSKYSPEPQPHEIREAAAQGLGILAHRPGGVTFSGQHWCTAAHDGCPGTWDVRVKDLHRVWIGGDERGARGAFFTPRHLAEKVVEGTLEALVYEPGPLQTVCCDGPIEAGHACSKPNWDLKPSAAILALTTCDIAVGAGVFLLASARYLSDRVQEAWAAEADPRAGNRTEALRLVAGHCLYGVDISPWSTELAKLTLRLLTPHTDVPELDRNIVAGDSLVGVSSLDQVRWMHMTPEQGRELHSVPHPYTEIVAEFMDVVEEAMRRPRPDLSHPLVWAMFGELCDHLTWFAYCGARLRAHSTKAQVHMLQAARLAHDFLAADNGWRG